MQNTAINASKPIKARYFTEPDASHIVLRINDSRSLNPAEKNITVWKQTKDL